MGDWAQGWNRRVPGLVEEGRLGAGRGEGALHPQPLGTTPSTGWDGVPAKHSPRLNSWYL